MFNNIKENQFGEIFVNNWEEWDHFFVPNKPIVFRNLMRMIMAIKYHCLKCTVLDGCYFLTNKKPQLPLHQNCDCKVKGVTHQKVKRDINAFCDVRKFTEYVFTNEKDSRGKIKIFNDLGYNINDSKNLANEYCVQAEKQYFAGNYILKNLDEKGQRLAIPIKLNGKSFLTGWMLYPEGEIRNTTPFGGWVK